MTLDTVDKHRLELITWYRVPFGEADSRYSGQENLCRPFNQKVYCCFRKSPPLATRILGHINLVNPHHPVSLRSILMLFLHLYLSRMQSTKGHGVGAMQN